MPDTTIPIFDAHLDLAYLAELGRDLTRPLDPEMEPHPPAAVTLPELRAGNVRACLGTIFLEATDSPSSGDEPICYPPKDAQEAYFKGINQLNRYHLWRKEGHIRFFADDEPEQNESSSDAIRLGILIEGADCIIDPDHLSFWAGRGVVAVSLSWAVQSRYAGGNETSEGISDLGRRLIKEMRRLDLALDLSHLSERATMDALDSTDVRICATHSNCRSLLGDTNNQNWQRHLSDDTIRSIAKRDGIIGLNLFRRFLTLQDERPTIARAVDHVEHICQLTGSAKNVGIGSDMDGGLSASDLPAGIDRAGELHKIVDEFQSRGYNDEDVSAFAHDNWARFFSI